MLRQLTLLAEVESPHDTGVHQVAALSARLAFALLCLGLCWGVFTSTGWLQKLTGRQATRGSHMVLIILSLTFASIHALAFLFMEGRRFDWMGLTVPMLSAGMDVAVGIVALELMLAIAISTIFQRRLRHRRWLRLHRLGYPAVALGVAHSFVGAAADGNLARLWIFGLAFAVPAFLLTALRFIPPGVLAAVGLVKSDTDIERALMVSVDNHRCHRYGTCQAEAPRNFELTDDGRLRYDRRPDNRAYHSVRMAARSCPMQAIMLEER